MFDPDELRALLVAHARAGEAVTYAEALEALGHRFTRPKMRQLCRVLGDVDAHARGLGEPELAVLVVRQSDRLPGQGWWVAGGADGHAGAWEGPEARRHVERLQRRVFAYWRRRADSA
jgi:hypothetical protein